LCALECERLEVFSSAPSPGYPGPARQLPGGDPAPAGEVAVFNGSLKRGEQMSQERGAAVQRLREFAKAGAGLVNRIDIPGAVKIMKVMPSD